MRILITGGNGFIGSHLVDALARSRQHQLVVLDLYPRPYEPLPDGVVFVPANLANGGFVRQVLIDQGIEVVYHLAWTTIHETSTSNPVADIEQNLIPTLLLLQACVYASVKRLVFISSGGTVYGIPDNLPVKEDHPTHPISAYGVTKLAAEKYLQLYQRLHGLDYVIFRPSVPYGPRQNPRRRQGAVSVFIYKALRGETIQIWGDGETLRDFFFVHDMLSALEAPLITPGLANVIFNLGGGQTCSLNRLVGLIRETLGLRARVRYKAGRGFDVPALQLDSGLAAARLNWSPKTLLEQGIFETAAWIQKWFF